jgi:hypothetical protein
MYYKRIFLLIIILQFPFTLIIYGDDVDFSHIILKKINTGSSSVLKEKNKPENYYGPDKAFDGKAGTAWCEGKNDSGIGEYIYSEFKPTRIHGFVVLNGMGKYKHLYFQNNRVKDFKAALFLSNGKTKIIKSRFNKDLCGNQLAGGKLSIEEYCSENVKNYKTNKKAFLKCIKMKKNECIIDEI